MKVLCLPSPLSDCLKLFDDLASVLLVFVPVLVMLTEGKLDRVCVIVQVRSAATMGGNLVLAKEQGLQSDVATLMSALQAQVGITSVKDEHLRHVLQCTQQ